jgi:hypothetical protein
MAGTQPATRPERVLRQLSLDGTGGYDESSNLVPRNVNLFNGSPIPKGDQDGPTPAREKAFSERGAGPIKEREKEIMSANGIGGAGSGAGFGYVMGSIVAQRRQSEEVKGEQSKQEGFEAVAPKEPQHVMPQKDDFKGKTVDVQA